MEDSMFRRSLNEMRTAGSHLRFAGELLVAATRESASALLARAWDSRVLVTVRRRVEQWRSRPGTRPELVRITLKEQAKVVDTLARRLSALRDELEHLSQQVAGLEERFAALPKERTA
jgi:flagellar motility protein MotE (MotC chaperone)